MSLVERCVEGDPRAQRRLYDMYKHEVVSIVNKFVGNDAWRHDIVNLAFVVTFKKIHMFKGEGTFSGWIRRITKHAISDFMRTEKHKWIDRVYKPLGKGDSSIDLDITLDNTNIFSIAENGYDRLYMDEIHRTIERLPKRTRQVLKMYAFEGKTHVKIAEELGMAEGSSKWHLHEARKFIKDKLNLNIEGK